MARTALPDNRIVAYDLDGIFQPDIEYHPQLFPVHQILRNDFKPLLQPKEPFALITGRPVIDKALTWEWVRRHFGNNPPFAVYHENLDPYNPVAYKVKVLKMFKTKFKLYVESDYKQTLQIAERDTGVPVIHYETLVRDSIRLACESL